MNTAAKTKPLSLDPRMKLVLVLVFSTCSYMAPNNMLLLWDYVLMISLWVLIGRWGRALQWLVVCLVALAASQLCAYIPIQGLKTGLGMLMFIIVRVLSFGIMASWLVTDLHVSTFICAMQKMHLPGGFIIALSVMLRYFPTVKHEFRGIRNTMKLRGIDLCAKNILRHPARTAEYALVPLVMRSMTVADELSASSMTRGLETSGNRTCLYDVKISAFDVVFTAAYILLLAAGLVLSNAGVGVLG